MELTDIPDVDEDEPESVDTRTENPNNALQMNDIIKDIKFLIEKHEDPKDTLNQYLDQVEERIETHFANQLNLVDQQHIKQLIEKHPYFKNPCNYHIRSITIMKYLKKKGIDISIPDIDLLIEDIMLSIQGVTKIGDGRYKRKKQ